MAGSVGLVQFNQGDDVSSAEFREGLNAVAQQAADGTAWAFGYGLIGGYSPGTGFTLAFDESLLPTMRKEHLIAKITAVADDDGGYAWAEMVAVGENTLEVKSEGRAGTGGDPEADPVVPAINLAYDYNGATSLKVDDIVTVWEIEDTAGEKRYWVDVKGGADFILAKITGSDEGAYDWEEVDAAGTAVEDGETGEGNLREINDRWGVQPGTIVMVWPDPAVTEGYLFDRAEGDRTTDGDVTVGPGEEDEWDRRTDDTPRGVKINVVTDVSYDTGTGELKKTKVGLMFDSSGRLVSATLGEPTNIATAEDCT